MNTKFYQRGYGGIEMFLCAVIIGAVMYFYLYPVKFNQIPPTGCIVGKAPEKYEEVKGYPAVSDIDADPAIAEYGGGPDIGTQATYVLIRKDVPMASYAFGHFGQYSPVSPMPTPPPGYTILYPTSDGGKAVRTQTSLDVRMRHEGVILFMSTDPTKVKTMKVPDLRRAAGYTPKGIFEDTIHYVDVYMDKRRYDDGHRGYNIDDLFACGAEAAMTEPVFAQPSKALVSPDKAEQQLNWFVFEQSGIWGVHCKPAIYLYPEKEMKVNVQVRIPEGELLYTDPIYPRGGWDVLAKPSGELHYLGSNLADSHGKVNYPSGVFPYLYYEGKVADSAVERPEEGYVIGYDKLASFFDELLPKLGLNEKESTEFKEYWLKALPYASYYFIGVVSQNNLNEIEPLTITPKQDTTIRVTLYFEQREKFQRVTAPKLQSSQREGFTVVEWGGMLKIDKEHPFTCVQ